MTINSSIPVEPKTLSDVPQLSRTRRILLILNAICFGIAVTSAVTSILPSTAVSYEEQQTDINVAVFLLLFYGCGFLVTYKYYLPGLCVFVGFAGIMIISSGKLFLQLIFTTRFPGPNRKDIAIRSIVFFDVMVIIFTFALKLALLINANEHLLPKEN